MNENELQQAEEQGGDGEGAVPARKRKKLNLIAKIGSVLLAFIIWYFAADSGAVSFEKKLSSIEIEIRGESEFSVLSGEGGTLDAVVSGKRSIISGLSPSDVKAYVDVTGIASAGERTLKVNFVLPAGVSLESASAETVVLFMDNTVEKTVPVDVEVVHYNMEHDYVIGVDEITTDVKTVKVTGPETAVSRVKFARLYADIGNGVVKDSLRSSGEIVLVDEGGKEVKNSYMSSDVSSVEALIPIYKKATAEVSVEFTDGVLNENNCKVELDVRSIDIIGQHEAVDGFELVFKISDGAVKEKTVFTFDIVLPQGIKSMSDTNKVTVTVEPIGSTETEPPYSEASALPYGSGL